jgi:GNAT superfamily N-acetyltransferase
MRIVTYADEPWYREAPSFVALRDAWPRYLLHDEVSNRYWGNLFTDFAEFQFALVDEDRVLAEGNSIPVSGMPAQWRDAFLNACESKGEPDRLCALSVLVDRGLHGQGLSTRMLEHMRGLATRFGELVAPVRPIWKERYPLIPIERYAVWRRADGTHFDPWIRTHERLGAALLGPAEEAMLIEGSASDWAAWTGMVFPDDGDYVVPGGLVPVELRDGRGVYREPCVWLSHKS